SLHILFCPYLPFSSQKLHEYLGFTGDVNKTSWRSEAIAAGKKLPTPAPLFPKLEELTTV
ncbi:MAG TPA: hypothetical protein VKX46_00870, partial [Ktedonobacteraceae bacterium]|nr:hypothetical protein [Ktedonobacteraceae bacterium]